MSRPGGARDAAGDRPLSGWLLALGYLLFAVAGGFRAVIEVLMVPIRIGTVLVPFAPVVAIVSNIVLPAVSRGLTDTMPSAAPPVVGWILTTFIFASTGPGGDVLLPAGDEAYISYSLLGLGTLTAIAMLVLASRPGPWTFSWLAPRNFNRPKPRRGSGSGDAR